MILDDRDSHRTRSSVRPQTPPAGTDHATTQARPAVEGDPGSGAPPLRPLPGSATCYTCGNTATWNLTRHYRDRSTGREWIGTTWPSCDFCADEDEARIEAGAGTSDHGSRVIGLVREVLA